MGNKKALQILQGFFFMIEFGFCRFIIINANALQDTRASSNTSACNDLKIAYFSLTNETNVYHFSGNSKIQMVSLC